MDADRRGKLTIGNYNHPTDGYSLRILAVAECNTVTAVTHKSTECSIVIPRERKSFDPSARQAKRCENRGSGESDEQHDSYFCLSGLHFIDARHNRSTGKTTSILKSKILWLTYTVRDHKGDVRVIGEESSEDRS
jgi:hypothetical protein